MNLELRWSSGQKKAPKQRWWTSAPRMRRKRTISGSSFTMAWCRGEFPDESPLFAPQASMSRKGPTVVVLRDANVVDELGEEHDEALGELVVDRRTLYRLLPSLRAHWEAGLHLEEADVEDCLPDGAALVEVPAELPVLGAPLPALAPAVQHFQRCQDSPSSQAEEWEERCEPLIMSPVTASWSTWSRMLGPDFPFPFFRCRAPSIAFRSCHSDSSFSSSSAQGAGRVRPCCGA